MTNLSYTNLIAERERLEAYIAAADAGAEGYATHVGAAQTRLAETNRLIALAEQPVDFGGWEDH